MELQRIRSTWTKTASLAVKTQPLGDRVVSLAVPGGLARSSIAADGRATRIEHDTLPRTGFANAYDDGGHRVSRVGPAAPTDEWGIGYG